MDHNVLITGASRDIGSTLARQFFAEGSQVVARHPGWVRTDIGWPRAPVDTIAIGLKSLLDKVGSDDNGKFFDYTEIQIPW